MDKMKAFVRTGSEDSRVELMEVSIPTIDENEALVKVASFGVGVHDRYFIPGEASFPYPVGIEGSGEIVEIGEQVKDFQVEDRVIFSSSMQPKGGSYAEYVVISSEAMIQMPKEMNFTEAAAIPVAGKTAIESMHALNLTKGDTLLIAGASGAIGTLVIQLAKNAGIHVIGLASSKNANYMKSLGAEETVDYKDPDWKVKVNEWIPGGVNSALAIQPGTGADSMDVVKDGAEVITVSGDKVEKPERAITVRQFNHQFTIQEAVNELMQDLVTEKVEIIIEHIYPFAETLKALKKTETRHARGKLVVSF